MHKFNNPFKWTEVVCCNFETYSGNGPYSLLLRRHLKKQHDAELKVKYPIDLAFNNNEPGDSVFLYFDNHGIDDPGVRNYYQKRCSEQKPGVNIYLGTSMCSIGSLANLPVNLTMTQTSFDIRNKALMEIIDDVSNCVQERDIDCSKYPQPANCVTYVSHKHHVLGYAAMIPYGDILKEIGMPGYGWSDHALVADWVIASRFDEYKNMTIEDYFKLLASKHATSPPQLGISRRELLSMKHFLFA